MTRSREQKLFSPEVLFFYADEWIVEPLRKTIGGETRKVESHFVRLRLGIQADLEEMQGEIRERLEGIESSLEIIAREMARKAGNDGGMGEAEKRWNR
jgi:hypothetical protein